MSSFEIDIRGDKELCAKLETSPRKVKEEFLLLVGQDTERYIRKEATGTKRHKGEYRKSFKREQETGQVTIFTDLKWAKFVHDGTRPHIIRPKNRKALSFTWNGEKVIYKQVKHPGYGGRHDIPHAISKVEPRLEGLFKKACQRVDL